MKARRGRVRGRLLAAAIGLPAVALGLAFVGASLQRPGPSAIASPVASHEVFAVCSLLPDPVAAFGRAPIASPNTFTVGANDRCLWVLERDPTRYVGVTLGPAANHDATIAAFGPGEPVAGLGDAALWWEGNKTLSVVAGDRNIQVDLNLRPADATRQLAEAVASQALGTLAAGR
jgi:hypothetical protein